MQSHRRRFCLFLENFFVVFFQQNFYHIENVHHQPTHIGKKINFEEKGTYSSWWLSYKVFFKINITSMWLSQYTYLLSTYIFRLFLDEWLNIQKISCVAFIDDEMKYKRFEWISFYSNNFFSFLFHRVTYTSDDQKENRKVYGIWKHFIGNVRYKPNAKLKETFIPLQI